MSDPLLIRRLIEEALDTGRTPDEVCRDHPELLDEVRRQWEHVRGVEAELDALFSTPRSGTPHDGAADDDPALPRIDGYDVEAVLGRGGMGVVYRARHRNLNRPVALKMVRAGAYASRQDLARFRHEAEAVAGLRHPHIVQVYDCGEAGGRPYFTMELLDGGSLAHKLGGTPMPARAAAELVIVIAGAAALAHANGIVHRDLKPANILLAADGTPKVSDFGLARPIHDGPGLTASGTRVGTPSYMAPEQALGRSSAARPAVDVYALGAVLYECLTGRPPFRGETAADTERQVVTDDPVPPSRLNPRVPRDLETVCLKCLQKDPARRYAGGEALADDLRRFLAGAPVAARRTGVFERAGKWARRRPAHTVALAGGLVLVVALATGAWWRAADRAATMRAVAADLEEATRAQRRSDWPAAGTALERAKARLGDRDVADLRARIDRAGREQELAARLDNVRLSGVASGVRRVNLAKEDRAYAELFRAAGLGTADDPPDHVADRVRATNITAALVTALDDWAICAGDVRLEWVLAVARQSDPDAAPWRKRARDPATWADVGAVIELSRQAPRDDPSVSLLLVLAWLLDGRGADAVGFLREVQFGHPTDFWVNFTLGQLLEGRKDPAAIGYYRAALVVRPAAAATHTNLGRALVADGQTAAGMDHWHQATRLSPDAAPAHFNLAVRYVTLRQFDRAAHHAEQAIRIDPADGAAYGVLSQALLNQGRFAEADAAGARALSLFPAGHPSRPNATHLRDQSRRMLALEPRAAAVAAGTAPPTDARESAAFGDYWTWKGRYAAATRMYADALARDPGLGADPDRMYRYDAANAAALAAAGAGDGPADAAARAALRAQALAWLRAECDDWNKRLPTTSPANQAAVVGRLRDWLTEPDLAGVREDAGLDALPADEQAQWRKLWLDVAAIAARDPAMSVQRARSYAGQRQWALAAAAYARAFQLHPTDDGEDWFEYAATQLLAGDRDGYRRACTQMLRRAKYPEMRAYHIARACSLAPGSVLDLDVVERVSRDELRNNAAAFWSLTGQGALHCRAGRAAEAVPLLEQSLRADPRPGSAVLNWLWLSIACKKLGRPGDAAGWLGRAERWLDDQGTEMPAHAGAFGLHLHNWLEAQVLRREATDRRP
ncbi:MAG TPA: protein kinase [Gemmataceae bacterium]|nr:protein kinase [Gemmataceae bacterium]